MTARIVVSGLLLDGIGLAEAARGYARALEHTDHEVCQHVQRLPSRPEPVGDPGPSGRLTMQQVIDDTEADVVVTCLNPPELRELRVARTRHPAGRANVGVWAWEVDPAPADWADEAGRFDEIWVNTEHIARTLRPLVDCPVVAIPPAVAPPARGAGASDLLDDRPTFLVLADAASLLERKNPFGAIEAFTRAFEPEEGPRLLIKVWNAEVDPEGIARLERVAAGRPDIDVVDSWLARDEFESLIASATCFVSLHRAEGMGLPIFEALGAGVPVIATGWSGPVDLIDDRHAFLVRSSLVEIADGMGPYGAGGLWAEPDLDHAAELMRTVWADREAAQARADTGRSLVLDELNEVEIGRRLGLRVESLLAKTSAVSPKSVLRPTIGVVAHGGEPWPNIAPFLRAIVPQVDQQHAELVIGVSGPDVLPEEHRPTRVRVVDTGSGSPFVMRTEAMNACDADLVVFTEDHCIPAPGWLLAYDAAFHTTDGVLFAGPIGNGSMGSPADWANYLMGFAAWAPPIGEVPTGRAPTVANLAIDGQVLRDAAGVDPHPGVVGRDIVPMLWRKGETEVVEAAIVDHVQGFPGWRHVRNHFDDARTAGAFQRSIDPTYKPSIAPKGLRAEARSFLRALLVDVQGHDDLVDVYTRAQHWLRLLAGARAIGLAVGARFGEGNSAARID